MKILLYIIIIVAIIFLYKKYLWCKQNQATIVAGTPNAGIGVVKTCNFFSLSNTTDYFVYGVFKSALPGTATPTQP